MVVAAAAAAAAVAVAVAAYRDPSQRKDELQQQLARGDAELGVASDDHNLLLEEERAEEVEQRVRCEPLEEHS